MNSMFLSLKKSGDNLEPSKAWQVGRKSPKRGLRQLFQTQHVYVL